jgi:hypothetical protein
LNASIRCVDNHPVEGGLSAHPAAYPFSSASGACRADYDLFMGSTDPQTTTARTEARATFGKPSRDDDGEESM